MERELVNIVEYLVLGEIESYLSADYSHQQVFSTTVEWQELMQSILNQLPPIYMWLSRDEYPKLGQLTSAEQDNLQAVVRMEIDNRLRHHAQPAGPHAYLMTEMFY